MLRVDNNLIINPIVPGLIKCPLYDLLGEISQGH